MTKIKILSLLIALVISGTLSVTACAADEKKLPEKLETDNGTKLDQSNAVPLIFKNHKEMEKKKDANKGQKNNVLTPDFEQNPAEEMQVAFPESSIMLKPEDEKKSNIQPVPQSVTAPAPVAEELVPSKQQIFIEPGVNTLIPVAIGQINRIVTPFEHPTVQHLQTENVKLIIQENIIYVSPNVSGPVAFYVSEKNDESVALSLSLVPQKIAPVEATLILSQSLAGYSAGVAGGKATKWEKKDSYSETVRNILRSVAKGDLPPGYTLSKPGNIKTPSCRFNTGTVQDSIKYMFSNSQYIQGANFSVIVGVAKNTGVHPVTVDESLCTHPDMAAVALWNKNTLMPGQQTEAYFLIRNKKAAATTNSKARPRLVE